MDIKIRQRWSRGEIGGEAPFGDETMLTSIHGLLETSCREVTLVRDTTELAGQGIDGGSSVPLHTFPRNRDPEIPGLACRATGSSLRNVIEARNGKPGQLELPCYHGKECKERKECKGLTIDQTMER